MRIVFYAFLWVIGLLVAASDGPVMPYANVIGLVLFLIGSVGLAKEGTKRRRRYLYYE